MFKFGVEKGRLAFFALIVAVTCGVMVLGDRFLVSLSASYVNVVTAFVATVIFTLVVNLISIAISIKYIKRENNGAIKQKKGE